MEKKFKQQDKKNRREERKQAQADGTWAADLERQASELDSDDVASDD